MSESIRQQAIAIAWVRNGEIGQLTIGGELWAAVEWSEKRQCWCIEDAEGRCLTHAASIRGSAASKDEAVALAEAMIRDGRMPDPETARERRRAERAKAEERERAERAKKRKARLDALANEMTARDGRAPSPREVRAESASRRRAEEQKRRGAEREALHLMSETDAQERNAQPLYETLDEAFDLGDPNLWKSNSFAALKPRLILHVDAAIADLGWRLVSEDRRGGRHGIYRSSLEAKLDRAKAIYHKLTGAEWAPRLSKWSQLTAQIEARTAEAPR